MSSPYKWKTGKGVSVYIHNMDTDHLQNLACWIKRKHKEYEEIKALAPNKLPAYMIQNRTCYDWLIDILEELKGR